MNTNMTGFKWFSKSFSSLCTNSLSIGRGEEHVLVPDANGLVILLSLLHSSVIICLCVEQMSCLKYLF